MSERIGVVQVFTHRRPADTARALEVLLREARDAGVALRFSSEETVKHGLTAGDGVEVDADAGDVDLAVVLGGDGTILTALRRFCGTGVPVFAANFGQVGFLATVEGDSCELGFRRAFSGEFETLGLPAIAIEGPDGVTARAINDVSINRKVGERVAVLGYQLEGEEVGSVRCDGVVVATPAGSTGYNLANGGPVLAWGVGGYVVSFIAPHSLTARPLVASPHDTLTVANRSDEPVDVAVDGRPAGELQPGESVACRFEAEAAQLAQLPGSTFYGRLREKFGHLV